MAELISVSTLLLIGVLGGMTAGTAFGLIWLTDRRTYALVAWSASLWFGAVACAFYILRPVVPDWTAVLFGNAMLAFAYGLIWLGFQLFEGCRPAVWKAVIGAVAWLPFVAVPFLRDEPALHGALAALVRAIYSLAIAWKLLQRRRIEPLPARLPHRRVVCCPWDSLFASSAALRDRAQCRFWCGVRSVAPVHLRLAGSVTLHAVPRRGHADLARTAGCSLPPEIV